MSVAAAIAFPCWLSIGPWASPRPPRVDAPALFTSSMHLSSFQLPCLAFLDIDFYPKTYKRYPEAVNRNKWPRLCTKHNKIHKICINKHQIRLKISLLHLLFPNPTEDMKNIVASDIDGDFNIAVEHLQQALHSIPQISEAALRPLLQLLLLGDQVDHFLKVLEMLCHTSCSTLPLRLKALILECFDTTRSGEISTLYEDILNKDPTSRYAVSRLLDLYQAGDYSIERLLDMMGLHLDAMGARFSYWGEFAACLHKLCECEEDAISVCLDSAGAEHERINSIHRRTSPVIFVEGLSGRQWKHRCNSWLYKHFRKQILEYDIASGDLQKIAYKAATASYFYGSEYKYVKQVFAVLEKHQNRNMLEYLRVHMQFFVGFFPELLKSDQLQI